MGPAQVVVVADDLTGALDSAAAFAERGLSVVAARTPDDFAEALASAADVVAVSTGTRECDGETAEAVLAGVEEALRRHAGVLFKKVDSRLKGNVAVETGVLAGLRTGGVLVCPAIPRLGRIVKDGAVIGAGVDTPIRVASHLRSLPADIVDARSDADIDRAVREPLDKQLFVGAAGLADALARRPAPEPLERTCPGLPLPVLFAVGSRDPVTLGQVAALIGAGLPVSAVTAPNGVSNESAADGAPISLIQMVPGASDISAGSAGRAFAESVVSRVASTRPQTLFACGGESANAILGGLGVGLLHVHGEIVPGVPVATARNGRPGLRVVTKSGGFGDRQTLIALCSAFLGD